MASTSQAAAELGHQLGQLTQRLNAMLPVELSAMAEAGSGAPNVNLKLKKRLNLKFHFGKVYDLAWSPNSDRLVTAAQDGKLLVWNGHGAPLAGDRGAVIHAVTLKSPWVQAVALSDEFTASGGLDNAVTLYRLEENELEIKKPSAELHGHEARISCLEFLNGGKDLISSSGDGTARVWDIEGKTTKMTLVGHTGEMTDFSIHEEKTLASSSVDGTAKVYDLRSGKCEWTFHGVQNDINSVAFHPSGHAIVGGSEDTNCYLWDIRACAVVQEYGRDDMEYGVQSVNFSKSGRVLYASYQDRGTLLAWDVLKPQHNQDLPLHTDRVAQAKVSPDGMALATASWDHTAAIWA